MLIDIIADGFQDRPTLRLYGFETDEIKDLRKFLRDAAVAPFGYAIQTSFHYNNDPARLLVLKNAKDQELGNGSGDILWAMPSHDWNEADMITEYFEEISSDRSRFQWLGGEAAGHSGSGFSVLLSESYTGQW